MKFSIDTQKFKSMIARAIKGAGQNKLIVLTNLMAIELKQGTLTTITTDGTNFLYIMEKGIEGADFSVTVMVEQFAKLISHMTSATTTLQVNNGVLEVSGNGKYSIELPLDENGELIKYPSPVSKLDLDSLEKSEVSLASIRTILNTVKPSLATTYEMPVLTNYFVGDKVIATDGYKAAGYNVELIPDVECLMSAQYMDLFAVMQDDTFDMIATDTEIVAISDKCIIYGRQVEDVSTYPVDAVENLIDESFGETCIINKQQLVDLLERMSIFVTDYDNGVVKMQFMADGVEFINMSEKSHEVADYIGDDNHEYFGCYIDINTLLQQVKAYISDEVEIHYGRDNSIKLVDDEITQVISLNE